MFFFVLPFFPPSHFIQSHQIMKMLDDADQNNISDIVSWSYKDARRFAIHDKKAFKNKILPRYLNNIKFTSFTKQMRRWGFVAYQGAGRNMMSFSHPMFIRGDRERCQRMRTVHQQSSRARKDDRIISSIRRGEGRGRDMTSRAMTTTNRHVSALHHAPDDRSSEEQARFLTTEDAAALRLRSTSSTQSALLHPLQQQEQQQQGSSYSAPPFPSLLSLLPLGRSSSRHVRTLDTSSHLLNADEQQVNLLARALSRGGTSYHSSLADISSQHDSASIQQAAAAARNTLLLQNNVVRTVAQQHEATYIAASIIEELEITFPRRAAVERTPRRTRLLLSERNAVNQLLQLHDSNPHLHHGGGY